MKAPTRIAVFARSPVAGACKTRLIPALGAEGAAALARRMLLHTLEQALAADIGPVMLCTTPGPGHPDWLHIALPAAVRCLAQGDGDLGQRLAGIARHWLPGALLLIGTDCPGLDAVLLRSAAEALSRHDAVLLPVSDGGYALLGLRRFDASLFSGIDWSTERVSAQTLERLTGLGWSFSRLPTGHDIDTPDDLQYLPIDWPEHRHA